MLRWSIVYLLLIFIKVESTTDYFDFQIAWKERIELDKATPYFDLDLDRLRKKYLRSKKEKAWDAFERVVFFCKDMKNNCNWTVATDLLYYEISLMNSSSTRQNQGIENLEKMWVQPTEKISRNLPQASVSYCKRIDYVPDAAEFLLKYVATSTPVIISAAYLQLWNSLRNWDLDYLKSKVGNEKVKLYSSIDNDFEKVQTYRNWKNKASERNILLSEIVETDKDLEEGQ